MAGEPCGFGATSGDDEACPTGGEVGGGGGGDVGGGFLTLRPLVLPVSAIFSETPLQTC